MQADAGYQREENVLRDQQLEADLKPILKRFDVNQDGKLDESELKTLKSQVAVFADAPPEMLAGRKLPLAPLIVKDFPSETAILKRYDANSDGALDGNEFKTFARELRRQRNL
jgi:Ca2+-binding EF-hand superfamily protein